MCGIAGFQGNFPPELLDRMNQVIAHRGPDGHGSILIGGLSRLTPVGLAHRRLAIIAPTPDGAQPMGVQCDRCGATDLSALALIYNGELYNYLELRDELRSRGHRFSTQTDSEVLLHMYAEYGHEMLGRLNGIFAFAIFDGRQAGRPSGVERGDVFLARDQIGVKPLYVAQTPVGVLFASELKALLQYEGVSRELDLEGLHYQIAYLWTPAPRTLLRAVSKVPPGFALVLRNGGVHREWSYYDVPYGGEQLTASASEIAAELRSRVEEAVRRQLMSDVPLGAFLSGGLDSSAVVAMMRKIQPDSRPTCYSIGFAGDQEIEGCVPDLPYARRVAAHLGVDLHTIEVGPSIIQHVDEMLYHLDEPQADPAPINALLIARQASRDGIKVLLSGAGGDDILSGYRRHQAIRLESFWRAVPLPFRGSLANLARHMATGAGGPRSDWARRLFKLFGQADASPDRRMIAYFWWSAESLRRGLYAPDVAAALDRVDTAGPLLASLERIPKERDPLNRMLYLETKHFLADHNLNYTDKMGMAAGVEVRVPLLDIDLVNYAAKIPSGMKQRGTVGKAIFKQAMEPLLPASVIYRRKSGFGAPLRGWLRNELRDRVDDTLSTENLVKRGIFDPKAVHRLVQMDRVGQIDGSYTVFALMCLELWFRQFLDQPVSSSHPAPPIRVALST